MRVIDTLLARLGGMAGRGGLPFRALLLVSLVPAILYGLVDLPLSSHVVISCVMIAVSLWVFRRMLDWRLAVAVLSVAASTRYIVWRGTETLALDRPLDAALSLTLYLAELYGFGVLVAGYFQTAILHPRRPVVIDRPDDALPSVDVFVPTYNEGLDILRRTLVGAMAIDWPRKTVWLLDDGRRPEVKDLALQLGCRYLTRPDNRGAKAGNINHALARTDGELVAIFDADHVPVRSFLRVTAGFFLENDKVGLVQTPHHFYNPDPFERNLWLEDVIPPEQEMFYHAVQIGNDFWNSAFFCGSCAVLRRDALESVGGIATETVTEDAHTALRMHAAGWESVYLDIPQAAGLATERYAFHVVQRMRWARGMTQIFRLENPLTRPGLSVPQRINYFNSIQHFLFGWPRIIYLAAPWAYLLFDVHPLEANAWEVAAYAAPHLTLSLIGGLTVARTSRQSFWAEVFEAALAPYTALVTTLALIAPRKGKFNVTPKGSDITGFTFDFSRALPNMVLLGLCLAALVATPWRWANLPLERGTLFVAAFWNMYNVFVLSAAVMVAMERPQRRLSWRVKQVHRIRVTALDQPELPAFDGETIDMSEGGVRFRLPAAMPLEGRVEVDIVADFARVEGLRAVVRRWRVEEHDGTTEVRVAFVDLSDAQRRGVIELMFTGQDAWTRQPIEPGHPMHSLMTIVLAPWIALWRALIVGDEEVEAPAK